MTEVDLTYLLGLQCSNEGVQLFPFKVISIINLFSFESLEGILDPPLGITKVIDIAAQSTVIF